MSAKDEFGLKVSTLNHVFCYQAGKIDEFRFKFSKLSSLGYIPQLHAISTFKIFSGTKDRSSKISHFCIIVQCLDNSNFETINIDLILDEIENICVYPRFRTIPKKKVIEYSKENKSKFTDWHWKCEIKSIKTTLSLIRDLSVLLILKHGKYSDDNNCQQFVSNFISKMNNFTLFYNNKKSNMSDNNNNKLNSNKIVKIFLQNIKYNNQRHCQVI